MNEYEKQAEEFLKRNKLQMTITKVPYTPPMWESKECAGQRNKYCISIHRKLIEECQGSKPAKRLVFDFWGSINDASKGKHPSPYTVLACISGDVHCPDTFKEFCSDYGYDEDSRKAKKTFKLARTFAKKLRKFFNEQELGELQEIQ